MRLVILDRDGVINQDRDDFVKSADEWVPTEGSMNTITLLTQTGYTVAVVTNQSSIDRKYFAIQDLTEMHTKMHCLAIQAGSAIDGIQFCLHTVTDNCDCRKPKPDMVCDILERFKTDPAEVWLVGDNLHDLQAVNTADDKSTLVLTGKDKKALSRHESELPENTQIFDNLPVFSQYITQETTQDRADGRVNA